MIKDIYKSYKSLLDKEVTISGWIKNHRKQKEFGFIDFYDGTCFKSVQVVYDNSLKEFNDIQKYKVGSCLEIRGVVIKSPKEEQEFEIKLVEAKLLGDCPDDYPIQPKKHSMEFLREQAYLRSRTSTFQAVFRVRSVAAFAIHSFFQEKEFVYVNTPILSDSDCEGAGEVFQVTSLDLNKLPKDKENNIDYSKDFFGKKVGLAVSGQLEGETYAMAFSNIYTFGPTFRAENSNTKTHASEFWMIEPEMAFYDLNDNMDLMEEMLKYVVKYVLEKCSDEIEYFDKYIEEGLKDKLNKLVNSKFSKITHHDLITLLKEAKVKWEFEPEYGKDIAKEHEKYITEYFDGPVFIKDWPKEIKAFYMKLNDDNKTVAAVDLEVPGAGELIGGSQREDDYDKLLQRMKEFNINSESLEWYLNLRKYGTCKHSGFGLGFERLIMYLTGMENIRDVIAYPRTPNNCEY